MFLDLIEVASSSSIHRSPYSSIIITPFIFLTRTLASFIEISSPLLLSILATPTFTAYLVDFDEEGTVASGVHGRGHRSSIEGRHFCRLGSGGCARKLRSGIPLAYTTWDLDEHFLARGHDRLLWDELRALVVESSEQGQGFFGNIISNVFTTETPQARSTANSRFTILLSFPDAVRICFLIWT